MVSRYIRQLWKSVEMYAAVNCEALLSVSMEKDGGRPDN